MLQAADERTSVRDVTEQTTNTPRSDRVLEWLSTVSHEEFEDAVNETLAAQAQQILLKATLKNICLNFVGINSHGYHHHRMPAELCRTTPAMASVSAIAIAQFSLSVTTSQEVQFR